MSHPRVSILLPNYNYAHTLNDTLSSVFAQTFKNFEVIAVDDASSDGSLAILRRWEARYPEKMTVLDRGAGPNEGISATYRLALTHAKAEVIAVIEADDLWSPENLSSKVDALIRNPRVVAAFSDYSPFDHPGGTLFWNIYRFAGKLSRRTSMPASFGQEFLYRNPVATFSNFVARASVLRGIPPAPDPKERFFDWWVMAHAAQTGPFIYLAQSTVQWRIHAKSANFGRFDAHEWRHLNRFLLSLYDSLRDFHQDAASLALLKKAETRISAFNDPEVKPHVIIREAIRTPWTTLRLLIYILLKNILCRSQNV